MTLGVDYSFARPGGAALKAAGVTGVMRYLSTGSKGLTVAEYADLKAHGLEVGLVLEGDATGMLNGRAQGISDAKFAVAQLKALGLPADSVVYAAADFDCYTTAQFAACDAYLQGWLTVIPKDRTGIYGGLYYVQHAHNAGLATYLWECASTSFRHGVSPASVPLHLQQTTQIPPVSGTDHNNILKAAFGQIGSVLEDDMPLTAADAELLASNDQFVNAIATAVVQHTINSTVGTVAGLLEHLYTTGNAIEGAVSKIGTPTVTISQADLAAALSKVGVTVNGEQLWAAMAPHVVVSVTAK